MRGNQLRHRLEGCRVFGPEHHTHPARGRVVAESVPARPRAQQLRVDIETTCLRLGIFLHFIRTAHMHRRTARARRSTGSRTMAPAPAATVGVSGGGVVHGGCGELITGVAANLTDETPQRRTWSEEVHSELCVVPALVVCVSQPGARREDGAWHGLAPRRRGGNVPAVGAARGRAVRRPLEVACERAVGACDGVCVLAPGRGGVHDVCAHRERLGERKLHAHKLRAEAVAELVNVGLHNIIPQRGMAVARVLALVDPRLEAMRVVVARLMGA